MPEAITPAHMQKVRAIARRVTGTAWRYLREDIEGAGMEALVIADREFDGRGTWEGYVFQRVAWRCMDALDTLIGGDPGSRNVRSPESYDVLVANWQRRDDMED